MVQLLVNSRQVRLLQKCPIVNSFEVIVTPFPQMIIPKDKSKAVADWAYDLSQRADFLTYNGIIIENDSVHRLFNQEEQIDEQD